MTAASTAAHATDDRALALVAERGGVQPADLVHAGITTTRMIGFRVLADLERAGLLAWHPRHGWTEAPPS